LGDIPQPLTGCRDYSLFLALSRAISRVFQIAVIAAASTDAVLNLI